MAREMSTLVVRERSVDGVVILSLSRGLKGAGEEELRQILDRLVSRGQLRVLIDLAGVPSLDSSDLGRLIRCHISIRQAGGRVRLCNLSPRVRDLMRLTRLETVLELHETEGEALASLHAPEGMRSLAPDAAVATAPVAGAPAVDHLANRKE